MKRFAISLISLTISILAGAQSAQEIISRMETAMSGHENEGVVMTVDTKIPIVGTMSIKTYTLGEKLRMEMEMAGVVAVSWTDGRTMWAYDPGANEVVIENIDDNSNKSSASGQNGNEMELFKGISDGYNVSIKKETQTAWHIQCSKSKSNRDKDAPKSMEIVVAKGTFFPISLSTKIVGISLTIRDISYGVTEDTVTFNAKDYPTATIIDKR